MLDLLKQPFWERADFWIGVVLGLAGVAFSVLAFVEARKAKRAATDAGRTVKIQTITLELSDIGQKLDKLHPDILFSEARDLLGEISRRLRRLTSPFAQETELKGAIEVLRQALDAAQDSLKAVRPTDPSKEAEVPNAVYFAIESDFAAISNFVADLLGLFERQTLNIGDANAER